MPAIPHLHTPQAEAHAHDAYDFSDDEAPPFREQLSKAAKRSHAAVAAGADGIVVVGSKPAKRGKR